MTKIQSLALFLIALGGLTLALVSAPSFATSKATTCADCLPQLVCAKRGKAPPGAAAGPCLMWQSVN